MKSATVVEYQREFAAHNFNLSILPRQRDDSLIFPYRLQEARNSTFLLPGFLISSESALVVSLCTKTNRVNKNRALSFTDNPNLDIAGQVNIGRHTISFSYIGRKGQKPFYMRTAWRNAGLISSNLVSYLFYRKSGQ